MALPVTMDVVEHLGGSMLIYASRCTGETRVIQSNFSRGVEADHRLAAQSNPA
ncbi:MAG: hypothetical protein QF877_16500 [Gammaproteobacteria bacterium]|nr:hypothetical protein [Arenicellales bacterium]MDP6734308.1 hypothetical protein [Gammaproteobacteria bacterium]